MQMKWTGKCIFIFYIKLDIFSIDIIEESKLYETNNIPQKCNKFTHEN
jgi:hypothetical protein